MGRFRKHEGDHFHNGGPLVREGEDSLGIELRRVGGGSRYTFGPGEAVGVDAGERYRLLG